jgi:hypothetical protein
MSVADHDAAERFLPKLAAELVGYLGKDNAPEDTELGRIWLLRREEEKRGTPPETLTTWLNVRLRRYTTMLITHDHMEFGRYMLCNIAKALSLSVRQGRSTLPSM